MITHKNLYDKICSLDNLYRAYRKANKGKSRKLYVIDFQNNLHDNLLQLKNELESGTYEPYPLHHFTIRDPKTRLVSASHFRDRVVHHALCNIIEPIFEKSFIHDSYANRKGKGTLAALERFDEFKRKVSHNGMRLREAHDNNMVVGFALKADIRHYFQTVDHGILLSIIGRKIKDEKVISLVRKILKNHSSGKGMPLGNLTSQFFANVYLSELDYFVKHELKAKYYIRYVDDFVILHQSKEVIEEYRTNIIEFLNSIKLELHKEKSYVVPLNRGVKLLGFRCFYHYKLPKKSNIRTFQKRLELFKQFIEESKMTWGEIEESVDGWFAYVMHADTHRMRNKIKKGMRSLTS